MNKVARTIPLIGYGVALGSAPAREWVLLDTHVPAQNWKITSQELGIKADKPFSVGLRTLHGGRQEGVIVIDVDTGVMKISIVPTRGMNVFDAIVGETRLGWDSPVSELVDPAFINLSSRGGLGWLEGFNEMIARCGFEWMGHPGLDQGAMLSLHGLACQHSGFESRGEHRRAAASYDSRQG